MQIPVSLKVLVGVRTIQGVENNVPGIDRKGKSKRESENCN